ncbi:MAG: stage II sporulation protein M [Pseudomonadota bacterium]
MTKNSEPSARLWEHWLGARLTRWRALGHQIEDNRKSQTLSEAREVLGGYREVAREVSLARREAPQSLPHRALEALYTKVHRAIHRRPNDFVRETLDLYIYKVPAAARKLRGDIAVVSGLFVLSAIAGALLIARYPDTASLFLSSAMMEGVQQGKLWTDDILNVVPSSVLSINLMTNNITVALTCLVVGLIYGLGTLYIICLNGLLLGGVFAYTGRYGMADKLFDFVIAHGIVELSVICLAGAAGLALGRALARPGAKGRVHSARLAMAHAGSLAAVAVPFLIGSGLIEGYVSPNPAFGTASRVTIGVLWFLVLLGALYGRPARFAGALNPLDTVRSS